MDGQMRGTPWLGMKIAEISQLDRILVIGSTLRKEQPLLAQRMRQAVKKGAQFNLINAVDDDLLMRVANKSIVAPSMWLGCLAQLVKAAAEIRSVAVPPSLAGTSVDDSVRNIAQSMAAGQNRAIFLGNLAQHHPQAAELHRLVQKLARILDARIGFFGEGANSVGGYLAGATPALAGDRAMNASQMLAQPRKAYLLLHAEMDFDTAGRAPRAPPCRQPNWLSQCRRFGTRWIMRRYCCRYRRLRRPAAVSSTWKAGCRPSRASSGRWVRHAPHGKCCGCSQPC
jgi:NADH-quinone oxidoreductase subunit G